MSWWVSQASSCATNCWERPCQGGPRSLVRILKCLMSAFCQGFTSLSEIDWHTFVIQFANFRSLSAFLNRMAVVCCYFIWALSLLFGPCCLSEFTQAGPPESQLRTFPKTTALYFQSTQFLNAITWFELRKICFQLTLLVPHVIYKGQQHKTWHKSTTSREDQLREKKRNKINFIHILPEQ